MKITVLKLEDMYGENCLSIFKKISPVGVLTDVVKQNREELYSNYIGVRLKVSFDDIKKEVIKDPCDGEIHVVDEENGVKVLLALEWPQNFATGEDKNNLELLEKYGKLKRADKVFEIYSNKRQEVVYFKEYKYVKINNNWAKIEPIEWYYDEKEQVLVSRKIFFSCPMLNDSCLLIKGLGYENLIITKILEEKFLKQAIMNLEEKNLYHFQISPFYEGYKEELKEINFWKNFLEKRKERRLNLEKIKKLSETELGEELSEIIEGILALNEEDEKYLKKYVIPYYCQK